MLIGFVAFSYRLFWNPPAGQLDEVDAVVVLSGGRGERLPVAVELVRTGVADTLAVSLGGVDWTGPVARAVRSACEPGSSMNIVCLRAEPDKTRGEAARFGELARQSGWESLAIVTSDYHLLRSVKWFRRCFGPNVVGVPAESDKSIGLIIHEWLGMVAFYTLHRHCPV